MKNDFSLVRVGLATTPPDDVHSTESDDNKYHICPDRLHVFPDFGMGSNTYDCCRKIRNVFCDDEFM